MIFLAFRLKFTTPHCYCKTVFEMLPGVTSELYQELDMVIEYAELVRDFANLPSGSLFFGSLLYLVKDRCPKLISQIVLILADRWPLIN